MKSVTEMPLFLRISLSILVISLAFGQFWLHDAASPRAVASARAAVASCPVLGRPGPITSQWDVVRAHDRARLQRLGAMVGIARPC